MQMAMTQTSKTQGRLVPHQCDPGKVLTLGWSTANVQTSVSTGLLSVNEARAKANSQVPTEGDLVRGLSLY